MVAKLIALYKMPLNKKEFDDRYYDHHLPIAQKIPGLQLLEISKIVGAPGGEAPFYLMAELYFNDLEAVKAGMESPEGIATIEDVKSFAGELVSTMYAEVHDKK